MKTAILTVLLSAQLYSIDNNDHWQHDINMLWNTTPMIAMLAHHCSWADNKTATMRPQISSQQQESPTAIPTIIWPATSTCWMTTQQHLTTMHIAVAARPKVMPPYCSSSAAKDVAANCCGSVANIGAVYCCGDAADDIIAYPCSGAADNNAAYCIKDAIDKCVAPYVLPGMIIRI